MPTITTAQARRPVAATGYQLRTRQGRYWVTDPDTTGLVHGGEWGDTLDGIADWLAEQ